MYSENSINYYFKVKIVKAVHKDFLREIKNTPGRFLSIFFIVALGVAFFSGIRAAKTDMFYTADAYYDRADLADIKALSSYGVTKKEVKALAALKGIHDAKGGYTGDYLTTKEDIQRVVRVHSLTEGMNELRLTKGRLPNKAGECVVDKSMDYMIGDKISLKAGKDAKLSDTLSTDTLTVVGIGESAFYIGFMRGNTNVGTGNVDGFCVVTEDTFDMEVYTEVYLTIEGAKEKIVYSDAYNNLIKEKTKELEDYIKELALKRQDDLKNDAFKEVDKAQKELNDETAKAQDEIDTGKAAIEDAKTTASEGAAGIESAQGEITTKQKQINEGYQEYDAGKKKLEEGKAAYEEGLTTYNASLLDYETGVNGLEALKEGIARLGEAITGLSKQLEALEANDPLSPEIEVIKVQIAELQGQLEEQQARETEVTTRLTAAKSRLDEAKEALEASKREIDANEVKLAGALSELQTGQEAINAGREELASKTNELNTARDEIQEKEAEIADGEKTLQEEADKGSKKIEEAKDDIEEIKLPKWEVDDRSAFPDYKGFKDNANRIGKVGQVFPAIFFLVAALVSLTTMTRLVEEQRTQIGILKALGYTRLTIAMKYIGYGIIASMTGSVLGVLVGEKVFPFIIIHAYGMMYKGMDTIRVPYEIPLALYASAIAVGSILLATLVSCAREMRETPAALMRPPAPKKGKRVVLERVPFIWKHLSFLWKSTIRNLFRYKKRFFMTVFGIGTCMGLLLTGFGIRDSVFDITGIQYSDIQKYQGQGIYEEDISGEEEKEINKFLENSEDIKSFVPVYFKQVKVLGSSEGKSGENAYLEVPDNTKDLSDFLVFRNRITHEEYILDNKGVIITEKLAKELKVKKGDTISLGNDKIEVKISNICENYMAHYIYMTKDLYKEVFGDLPTYNGVLFNTTSNKDKDIERTGEKLIAKEGVISVSYAGDMRKQMDDMIGSLNMVIIVLIISAGLLAFVVLYNLNIVNIEERKRELATLKVLGFYDLEVGKYVYRENIILTIIGAVAGVIFGIGLHQFVIQTLEVEMVMFGRTINPPSYVYSILLTIAFSAVVNFVMFFKLKKIDMVTSLKSHE